MEILTGEDFDLTDSIKAAAHEKYEQIEHVIAEEAKIKFFFKRTGELYDVVIKIHHKHNDFIGEHKDRDFYIALNHAKDKIVKQITKLKHKNISQKRKRNSVPEAMLPTKEELEGSDN